MKKFKKIYIEITNVCNQSCEFCPKTSRQKEFMSLEVFHDILKKVKGYSEYIYFHVMGEPLLHPDIGSFLELCQKHGFRVNLTTNGTLIEKTADTIIAKPALRQINFSLHSFEANNLNYSIDVYMDKIFKFIRRAKSERELLFCLRLWNLSENKCNNIYNNKILRSIEEEFLLDYKIEDKLTSCRGIKLADYVFLNQSASFEWPDMEMEEVPGEAFCLGLRDQVGILVDGTVVPCCLDREGVVNLGNIKEQDFNSIIMGNRAASLYNGFSCRRAVEELCKKCSYRTRFNH